MAKVHLAAATFYKHVEVETTTAFVETLEKQTDYQVFLAEACAPATRHHLAVQSLGINLPPGLEAPVQVSKQKAMELYIGMVNRLALEKTKKEALDEKEKNQREKLKEEVRNANPRDLFDQAVRQVLQETPSSSMRSQVEYVKAVAESKEDCIRDKAPVLQHQPKGAGRGRGKPSAPNILLNNKKCQKTTSPRARALGTRKERARANRKTKWEKQLQIREMEVQKVAKVPRVEKEPKTRARATTLERKGGKNMQGDDERCIPTRLVLPPEIQRFH